MQSILPHASLPTLTVDSPVTLRAMVHRIRELRGFAFVHLRTPGELLQAVWTGPLPPGLREQSAVEVTGLVVAASLREPALTRRDVELQLSALEVLSTPELPMPFDVTKPALTAGAPAIYDHRPLSLRHPSVQAVFTVQQELLRGIREALFAERFTEIHSPKLGAEGAEGGANLFELDYFGRRATLAQSPQLYKELGTGAFLQTTRRL